MGSRSAQRETLLVGEVRRPHGLRGDVKIEVLSDVPDRFEVGRELLLVTRGTPPRRSRVRIASFRAVRGGALVRFEGYASREQADEIRGSRLEVELSEVPAAPEGSYYYHELVGCRCVDVRHGELGEVVDVVEDGGGVLLQVEDRRKPSGNGLPGPLLVPFVESFLTRVDVAARRIDLRLPPGLVETCASRS